MLNKLTTASEGVVKFGGLHTDSWLYLSLKTAVCVWEGNTRGIWNDLLDGRAVLKNLHFLPQRANELHRFLPLGATETPQQGGLTGLG